MKIYIITEGSTNFGFGHIARCQALYDAFRAQGIKPNFIINGDEKISEFLAHIKYVQINWIENSQELLSHIKNADLAIIDSYKATIKHYQLIQENVKKAVYLDDFNRLNYPSGIVLNGSIHAEQLNYCKNNEKKIYLLGERFAPLRIFFWNQVRPANVQGEVKTIILTMGGDDMRNLTPGILNQLNKNFPHIKKKIVVGAGFNNLENIKAQCDQTTDIHMNLNGEEMYQLIKTGDLAISAGGMTLYELAVAGVPTIGIQIADNQYHNIKAWNEKGFIDYAGKWDDSNLIDRIIQLVNKNLSPTIRAAKANIAYHIMKKHNLNELIDFFLENANVRISN